MTTKKKANTNFEQIKGGSRRKQGVQNLADFLPENDHKRLDEMIDQTIYIWKIEPQTSEKYGEGFKIWFKDLPNARDSYTASIYGQYVVPQLNAVWVGSNKGSRISLDSPVKATIRQAGRTYRFE